MAQNNLKEHTEASEIVLMIEENMVKELHIEGLCDGSRNMAYTFYTLEWLDNIKVYLLLQA